MGTRAEDARCKEIPHLHTVTTLGTQDKRSVKRGHIIDTHKELWGWYSYAISSACFLNVDGHLEHVVYQ